MNYPAERNHVVHNTTVYSHRSQKTLFNRVITILQEIVDEKNGRHIFLKNEK